MCAKCKQGKGEQTLCDSCVTQILSRITYEDALDIIRRCDKAVRDAERCANAREKRAEKRGTKVQEVAA